MSRITDFSKGDRIRLVGFGQTDVVYKRRLLSLGFTYGTEVRIVQFAPLGCPVLVEVRDTYLSLRKEEAADLQWEQI
ncbi:ferrous iron transport protein A [Legionella israelensis]|uniref:Ferrous iron transport protein A n=2 Tax=Legionella israelensis TaxID=454 RepID=A0A0W0W1H4_9GAMM|nr:FeoA family protein [Legionella israelensis]KTD26099.1 ferrous iron transporter A [Legionella israelensis]QBR84995.1 ferrous iron transport protein A [Legionella israelensis]QBS10114.1 ferrous iron transport protein A [Legionella israelensis]QDP73695.1 ferrous iron transport protein A [Legionella israelensis]SCY07923.1 ferrous iron transport protein A [Legionella israelensis DSM 19235]